MAVVVAHPWHCSKGVTNHAIRRRYCIKSYQNQCKNESTVSKGLMTRTSAAKTAAEILAEARIDNFVPLLEELLNVGSYEAALGMSIRAAMETTMFTALACLLTYVGMISTSKRDPQKGSTALGDFFNALSQPVFHLLPFYSVLRLGTITCAMLQYIALQMPEEFTKIMGFQTENATRMLTRGTQFLEDSCELMLITFLAWFVIRIKDRILSEIQLNFQVEKRAESSGIVRLIESAKSLSSIAISLLSIIMALRAYGLDIGPLLTSLGASSIILGFAAQST